MADIPGQTQGKYTQKNLLLCQKVKKYSKNSSNMSRGYKSQTEEALTGKI